MSGDTGAVDYMSVVNKKDLVVALLKIKKIVDEALPVMSIEEVKE